MIYDITKIWRKRLTHWLNELINQWISRLFIEQPRLHRVQWPRTNNVASWFYPQLYGSAYKKVKQSEVILYTDLPEQSCNGGTIPPDIIQILQEPDHHCFGSHSLKGSWAGLVTLTAYMAAKIGIEEYLMELFVKILFQCEDTILRWKIMAYKIALIAKT